jgi:hypothetical protein
MARNPVPWIGLVALIAMFILPYLPNWLFEGPRTIRHWPRREICGVCGADWTTGHVCEPSDAQSVLPSRRQRLVGELRRLDR